MPARMMLSEIFGPVVQGEGPIIGKRTIFVRTFGCDSYCMGKDGFGGCDTLYAVDPKYPGAETRKLVSQKEVAERVLEIDPDLQLPVTISGGNPAMWDLTDLIFALSNTQGRQVWTETQGTMWNDWLKLCDKVVISPKGPGMNDIRHGVLPPTKLEVFANNLDDLSFKVVIFGHDDLDYAESIHQAFPEIPLYLSVGSPVGNYDPSVLNASLRTVIEWSLRRPKLSNAIVLPQLHALAFGGTRGV